MPTTRSKGEDSSARLKFKSGGEIDKSLEPPRKRKPVEKSKLPKSNEFPNFDLLRMQEEDSSNSSEGDEDNHKSKNLHELNRAQIKADELRKSHLKDREHDDVYAPGRDCDNPVIKEGSLALNDFDSDDELEWIKASQLSPQPCITTQEPISCSDLWAFAHRLLGG